METRIGLFGCRLRSGAQPPLSGVRPRDSSAEVEGIAALEDAFNNCIEALLR